MIEPETLNPTTTAKAEPRRPSLSLADDPAKIAAFLNSHRKGNSSDTPDSPKPPYQFADFVADMEMTNFEDWVAMRSMLESQAHLLGTAFQYLMMEGDWKNLGFILRTQKVMRDTMSVMNEYPNLSYWDSIKKAEGENKTPPITSATDSL